MHVFAPVYLWLLLLLIPVIWLLIAGFLSGRKGLRRLAGGWRNAGLQEVYLSKTFLSGFFFIAAVALLVFSLSDVRGRENLVEDQRRGYEIALALDVSRSMMARDVYPSRLEWAAREVGEFIRNKQDTRFSLVLFKGKGSLFLPMTRDLTSFDPILKNVSPDLITSPGSSLQEGLQLSLSSFRESGRFRAIVLLTDGESLTGRPIETALAAGRAGIPICPIAVGTDAGAEIPEGRSVLYNSQGKPVVTRLMRDSLEEIATASGGEVFSMQEMDSLWRQLPSMWKDVKPGEEELELKLERPGLYRIFVLISLLLLSLSMLIRGLRWRRTI